MCGGRDLHVDLVLRAEARELVLVDRLQHRERLVRALDAHGHAAHVVQHLQVVSLYQSQRCLYIIATDLSRSTCCAPPGRTTRGRTWRDSAHPHTPPLPCTPRLSRQQSPRCPCQEHHTRSQEHHTCVSGASHTHVGSITHSPVSATKPVMPIPSLWSYMLPMPSAPPTPSPPAAAPDDAADPTGTVSPTCICPGERHRDTSVTSIETPRLRIQRHLSD